MSDYYYYNNINEKVDFKINTRETLLELQKVKEDKNDCLINKRLRNCSRHPNSKFNSLMFLLTNWFRENNNVKTHLIIRKTSF
jgi:hypothetical protein